MAEAVFIFTVTGELIAYNTFTGAKLSIFSLVALPTGLVQVAQKMAFEVLHATFFNYFHASSC